MGKGYDEMIKISKDTMEKGNKEKKDGHLSSFARAGIVLPSAIVGGMMGTRSAILLGNLSDKTNGVTIGPYSANVFAAEFANKNGFPAPDINFSDEYLFKGSKKPPSLISVGSLMDIDAYSLAHELGHAKDFYRGTSLRSSRALSKIRPLYGLGGAVLATSDNDTIRNTSPYVSVLPGLPVLYDEGRAWVHAYKYMKSRPEWSRMPLKSKLSPFVALGTYAGALTGGPLLATLIAKGIKEKTLKRKKGDVSNDKDK